MDLHGYLDRAELLDWVVEDHLLAVEVESELALRGLGDFLGGDGAEGAAGLADLDRDVHGHFRELLGKGLGLLKLLRRDAGLVLLLELDVLHVLRGGLHAELAREEHVAGIAVRNIDDVVLLANRLHIFQ